MKQELRREKVIENITTKLDTEGKLLMVGESGTSKNTVLMEVMCDYFDKGFKILYNFGDTDIRNVDRLISLIEAILKDGNKVLVAIDNVHEERTSPIFYVLDKLHSFKLTSSLKIILTARLPDLDIFVKERISKVPERFRKSIRNLTNDTNFKYPIPYFTREEIKEFIRLYSNIFDKELADKKVQEIYDDTKGHPYMVQFSLFHRSLRQSFIEKHDRYLTSPLQMKAMLVCCILNIASLKITTTILEQCGVIKGAYRLLGATLNKSSEGIWKTFHTQWDEEWLSILYNDENEAIVLDRKQNLRNAIDAIFNLGDEKKLNLL